MKIAFLDNDDIRIGSTRIWIYNLAAWLNQISVRADINPKSLDGYDVCIFGKSFPLKNIEELINSNQSVLFGHINPSDYNKAKRRIIDLCDFFIVGSNEEKCYYNQYSKNVFIFPLIEKIFTVKKNHKKNQQIFLCYHGNKEHLEEFSPYLKEALEIFSKERDILLKAIYNKEQLGEWKKGRPNIKIKTVQFDINTIQDEILECDIGLIPGLVPISSLTKKVIFKTLKLFNLNYTGKESNYLIRFKNTTNSGRAFVFHQLGIPVISDFLPSNFHILSNPECGYLVHDKGSWLNALRELSSSTELRQKIANNALEEFNSLYDPLKWAKSVYKNIKELYVSKFNNV